MVYVVQQQLNKNLLPARPFGELSVILQDKEQVTFTVEYTVEQFEKKLATFNSKDYLLLIGDPIAIGIAMVIAARNNNGVVNTLKWDRQERVYIPVTVKL